ncbi:MAG: DUF664 domain-containing protein [Anaerolineaceae bacterium]
MNPEIEMYLVVVEEGCEAAVRALDGLGAEAIRWKPAATANSLAAIAKHSLANAERNVLMTFAGEAYQWRREQEFLADDETVESLTRAWALLRGRMRSSLEAIPESRLTETLQHPRMGAVPGRAVLLRAARHVSEHASEAELTRSLFNGRGA